MCKADAYKRLKTMENNIKLSPLKVVTVAYQGWLFTRGGNHRANLTEHFDVLDLWGLMGSDCLPDQRWSHTEVWLYLQPSGLHFCSSSFLRFRKLCLVWLVEVLDRTLGSSVLTLVTKHVNMDSIALSILPSGKHPFPRFNKNLVWKRSF